MDEEIKKARQQLKDDARCICSKLQQFICWIRIFEDKYKISFVDLHDELNEKSCNEIIKYIDHLDKLIEYKIQRKRVNKLHSYKKKIDENQPSE